MSARARRGIFFNLLPLLASGWILGFSALALGAYNAQDLWVEAQLNTTTVYVGQSFHYYITAGIKNGSVRLPGGRVLWPGCRLLAYREKDVSDLHEGFQARQGQYALMALGLDAIDFPPLKVEFAWPEGTTATASGAALKLKIASWHPQGLSMRPWRGPRQASRPWVLWLLPVVPLGAAALWLALRKTKRRSFRMRPPHQTAYQKLETLGRSHAVIEGRVDEYFRELSRLLRQYAADRFKLPALELPRAEIVACLKQQGVPPHVRRGLNVILIQADWVKFAKSWVEFSEIAVAQRRARQFIDQTRPVEPKKSGKKKNLAAPTIRR